MVQSTRTSSPFLPAVLSEVVCFAGRCFSSRQSCFSLSTAPQCVELPALHNWLYNAFCQFSNSILGTPLEGYQKWFNDRVENLSVENRLFLCVWSPVGCEIYSNRRVSGSRGRTAELPGAGRAPEWDRVYLCCGSVESGNRFTGNVLRNETETYSPISGMEGETVLACTKWILLLLVHNLDLWGSTWQLGSVSRMFI